MGVKKAHALIYTHKTMDKVFRAIRSNPNYVVPDDYIQRFWKAVVRSGSFERSTVRMREPISDRAQLSYSTTEVTPVPLLPNLPPHLKTGDL